MKDRLRQIRIFAELDDKQLDKVAAIARIECVASDGVIITQNESADELRGVVDGRVLISIDTPGREEQPVSTISAGEIFGWSALLPQSRWLAKARALKNTTLIVVAGAPLRDLCSADHELGYHVMHHTFESVAHRLHDTWLQLTDTFAT